MDLKKFIENQGLDNFPIGLGGCRNLDYFFLASKFDARGDAGELFKDFSYF